MSAAAPGQGGALSAALSRHWGQLREHAVMGGPACCPSCPLPAPTALLVPLPGSRAQGRRAASLCLGKAVLMGGKPLSPLKALSLQVFSVNCSCFGERHGKISAGTLPSPPATLCAGCFAAGVLVRLQPPGVECGVLCWELRAALKPRNPPGDALPGGRSEVTAVFRHISDRRPFHPRAGPSGGALCTHLPFQVCSTEC